MDNRGPTMVEGKFDFGFMVDWMRKDRPGAEEARRNGARPPVTALGSTSSTAHIRSRQATTGTITCQPDPLRLR